MTAVHSEPTQAFYEGKWTETDLSAGSLRNLLVKKERFFLRQLRGRRGIVLDMGCGGGWRYFTRLGKVVGLDLSHASLRNARQIYPLAVQASGTALPFADATFDFVVSLDLLGHIPVQEKGRLVSEIWRVLRPGGQTVHYVETLSEDPMNTFARRYPDLYYRHVVAPEGHVGLETPAATFERFRRAGFTPVYERPVYKGAVYVERFVQYFDNAYREHSRLIRLLVAVLRPLTRIKPLALLANLLVTLYFEAFDPILPEGWAGGVLVCYAREPESG